VHKGEALLVEAQRGGAGEAGELFEALLGLLTLLHRHLDADLERALGGV